MKGLALFCIFVAALASLATAESPSRRPGQFYTNGERINAWTAVSQLGAQTTFWFARHPSDSAAYRQMLAIIYDEQPDRVYYINAETKRIVGRLDLETDQFSLLPADARRGRLQDIEESSFPAPGELPRVAQMFGTPTAGDLDNNNRLRLPPPTMKYPRLKRSTWESSYMAIDRSRIRATLELQDDRGTYRLRDKPGMGQLSDIRYESHGDGHVIQGHWVLGKSSGWFQFDVSAEDLNVFWGEFGFEPGRVVGAWDGIRDGRPALKETGKPLR